MKKLIVETKYYSALLSEPDQVMQGYWRNGYLIFRKDNRFVSWRGTSGFNNKSANKAEIKALKNFEKISPLDGNKTQRLEGS